MRDVGNFLKGSLETDCELNHFLIGEILEISTSKFYKDNREICMGVQLKILPGI